MTDFMTFVTDTKRNMPMTTSLVQYPTGFMYLDYGVGSYLTVRDDNDIPIKQYHNIGLAGGSVNVIISKSQGGKTSLSVEMAVGMIEPFINDILKPKYMVYPKKSEPGTGEPFIQIGETEKTLTIDYVKKLSRYKNKDLKSHTVITPITTDKDVIDLLEAHIAYKVTHMKPIIHRIPDIYGNPIIGFPPSVIIFDSMSQVLLEEIDDPTVIAKAKKQGNSVADVYESAAQNTAGARRAKIISAIYSQLVNYASKFNITIFSINHINKMPAMNGIPVKQYRGLKASETIGGGERAIFLAANILRIDVIKNVGGASSSSINLGDGIKGHIAIASWIKSKSNSYANTCNLVYTTEDGWNPVLSTLYHAKEIGDLPKAGNFYYLDGAPNLKFTLKNYQEVFANNPTLISAYYDHFRDRCAKLLDDPNTALTKYKKLTQEAYDEIQEIDSGSSLSDVNSLTGFFNS